MAVAEWRAKDAAGWGVIAGIGSFVVAGGFFAHDGRLNEALLTLAAYVVPAALFFALASLIWNRFAQPQVEVAAVAAAVPRSLSSMIAAAPEVRRSRARSWMMLSEGRYVTQRRDMPTDSLRLDPRLAGLRAALNSALPPARDHRFDDLLRRLDAA